jgi:Fe-S cluster assembly ATPase SufC
VVNKNPRQSQQVEALLSLFHLEPFLDRAINAALSGGEIKRSELFQLLMTQPQLALLDEPDSGIDLETLPLVGQMVNTLLAKTPGCLAKRSAALYGFWGDHGPCGHAGFSPECLVVTPATQRPD